MKKILMASVALVVFAGALLLFQMTSCKKANANNCPPAVYPVAGLWTGTYQTDQVSHAPAFYSFALYPDGSLLIQSKGVPPAQDVSYSKGSWKLTGNVFTYTDTTINYSSTLIQSGQLTFSNTGTMTAGTWKDITGDGGNFYTGTYPTMTRVN